MPNNKSKKILISSLIAGASGGLVITSLFTAALTFLFLGASLGSILNLMATLNKK